MHLKKEKLPLPVGEGDTTEPGKQWKGCGGSTEEMEENIHSTADGL